MKIFSLQHFPTRGVASGPGTRGLAGRVPACLAPAREDLTESEKLFQFAAGPDQICHAWHLGPWATAHRFSAGSGEFENFASTGLEKGPVRRRSPGSSPPAHRPLPPGPGKKRSPRNFFNSAQIRTKFGMHVTWDHGRPPNKFEKNPTTLNFLASRELGQGAGEDALAGKRPTGAPAPASPARGKITQSQKNFYFLDYLHQIWHA